MALPYKLIKSLTIDGETMGLDPDLGKMLTSISKSGTLAANTWLKTDAYTIPENGMYLVEVSGNFGSATTTGVTKRATGLFRGSASNVSYQNSFYDGASTGGLVRHDTHIVSLNAGTTIQGAISSDKAASNSTVWLEVTKILKTS